MKQDFDPSDEKLSGWLKSARPIGELSPAFQNRVWQRIERLEQTSAGATEARDRYIASVDPSYLPH
jgi:hypothetical protein